VSRRQKPAVKGKRKHSVSRKKPVARQLRSPAPSELVTALKQIDDKWAAYFAALPKGADVARHEIARQLAIRDGLVPPPWMKSDEDKPQVQPQVQRARELMNAVYANGEWRTMMIKAVHAGCTEEARAREWRLPSPDSFSIAMGRRKRRPK
jgi:hypothetical protein